MGGAPMGGPWGGGGFAGGPGGGDRERGRDRGRGGDRREDRRDDSRKSDEGESKKEAPKEESSSDEPKKDESSNADEKVTRFAQGMLNQNDKNKNGKLEKDEWPKSKMFNAQKADADGDGVITLDEMKAQLGAVSKAPPTFTSKSSGSSDRKEEYRSSPSAQVASVSSGRSTGNGQAMRFLTPAERLPSGLPGWFSQSDRDGDGQVMMAEYSSYWTDEKIKEFNKYDLNADGTITPNECLTADRGSRGR
jgi:hypothetical protein